MGAARWALKWIRRWFFRHGRYVLAAAALSLLVIWFGYLLLAIAVHLRAPGLR